MCNTCYTSVQDSVPSKAREDLEEKTVDNIEEACYPYFKDYEEQSSLE
jgi:hypothetical protein